MLNKEGIIKEYKDLIDRMCSLQDAWGAYTSEPFMQGKFEGMDIAIQCVNTTFKRIIEGTNE